MNGRKRTVQVKFYVTEEERKLIEEKIYLFKEVQAALFAETGAFGLNQGMTHKEANEKREELRQQMETLETMTENYRKRYNMICGLFSDK